MQGAQSRERAPRCARSISDSFPRRRGKARIGVIRGLTFVMRFTPTLTLPRRGGEDRIAGHHS